LRSAFHDLDLVGRQAVELVHKLIDLLIRRRNLPLERLPSLGNMWWVWCLQAVFG
jgi:hypothetical protein